MDDIVIALTIALVAVILVAAAIRLRATPRIGGTIRLTDHSDNASSSELLLKKVLEASGTSKPVVAIAMTTTRRGSGEPVAQEVITIDGQTYHSIEEIPPDVRDHVRKLLADASRAGSRILPGGGSAMARIETDMAELGLDVRAADEPADPPSRDA